MLVYFGFSLFCVAMFVFEHWLDGQDLHSADLFDMTFMALFPVMNVICLVFVVLSTLGHLYTMLPLKNGVILKGLKR